MRNLLALSVLALSAASQAALTITLDRTTFDVSRGGSYQVTATVVSDADFYPASYDSAYTQGFASEVVSGFTNGWWQSHRDQLVPAGTYHVPVGALFAVKPDATLGAYTFRDVYNWRDQPAGTPQNLQFQGIHVNVVPEPASLAALGLPCLALLRRRKR